jgi:hypothetical protein
LSRPRSRACSSIAAAVAASLALQGHPASAAPVNGMTTAAAFKFSFPTQAFPCPLTCVGTGSGTFEGTISGLDVNTHPFTATFVATGVNMTGAGANSEACTGDPSGELIGGGSIDATVTGGTLVDNGITTTGASLVFAMPWWQYGTALVLMPFQLTLKDGSGATVQTAFTGGDGVGTLVPIWNPFGVPLSCFDQFPATIVVTGSFAVPV